MEAAKPMIDSRKASALIVEKHRRLNEDKKRLAYVSGMGCATNSIIQLTVMSRKFPLKTAESPRKSVERFIGYEKSIKNYLN